MWIHLRSYAFLAFFWLSSALFFLLAVVVWALTVAFDRRLVILHLYSSFWASVYLWTLPNGFVSVEGRERIRRGATYVVVSNHQSLLDILVAYRLFFPFKWVSKAEVFRVPFLGWNMRLNRYIGLKRGDPGSIRKMWLACERALAQGSSVYIFPEGTRSETGRLKRFKPGAFALAKDMQVPILPIAIIGSTDALPPNRLLFEGRHHIRIKVLEEIPYERFADVPVGDLSTQVQQRIADEVERRPEAAEV